MGAVTGRDHGSAPTDQRAIAGRALVDDFIASRNERGEHKPNPLTTGQRWHNTLR